MEVGNERGLIDDLKDRLNQLQAQKARHAQAFRGVCEAIRELEARREQCVANMNAVDGAVHEVADWLQKLEAKEPCHSA